MAAEGTVYGWALSNLENIFKAVPGRCHYFQFRLPLFGPIPNYCAVTVRHFPAEDDSRQTAWIDDDLVRILTRNENADFLLIGPLRSFGEKPIYVYVLIIRDIHCCKFAIRHVHCARKEGSLVRKLQTISAMVISVLCPQVHVVVSFRQAINLPLVHCLVKDVLVPSLELLGSVELDVVVNDICFGNLGVERQAWIIPKNAVARTEEFREELRWGKQSETRTSICRIVQLADVRYVKLMFEDNGLEPFKPVSMRRRI